MRINSIYGACPQGEGLLSGVMMPFVRVGGCNLSCSWCDSSYTWQKGYDYTEMTPDAVLAALEPLLPGCRWVSLTGGEPTIYQDAGDLITCLGYRGINVIVETNGLRVIDWLRSPNVFVSCSPKLPGSGQDTPARRARVKRLVEERLKTATGRAQTQWKFVIAEKSDLKAMIAYAAGVGIDLSGDSTLPPVYLMPNGYLPTRKYLNMLGWLQEHAPRGCRVCPQVHRLVHGPNAKDV